jgi:hypothetical protein
MIAASIPGHTSRIDRARHRSPRASSVVSRATKMRDDAAHDWAWPSDASAGAHVVGESFRVKGLHLTNHEIAVRPPSPLSAGARDVSVDTHHRIERSSSLVVVVVERRTDLCFPDILRRRR